MRALLIDPENQTIEEVDVAGLDDLASLIGFDTIESDAVGSGGDRLYFDEECFLRSSPGRFQIDTLVPVSGKGVILGTAGDGATPRDAAIGIEELRARIKFQ